MTSFLTKTIGPGETATVSERLADEHHGLWVRYRGPASTFEIESMTVGARSCFAGIGPAPADGFEAHLPDSFAIGTEAICRVRNYGSSPATFVAVITGL